MSLSCVWRFLFRRLRPTSRFELSTTTDRCERVALNRTLHRFVAGLSFTMGALRRGLAVGLLGLPLVLGFAAGAQAQATLSIVGSLHTSAVFAT